LQLISNVLTASLLWHGKVALVKSINDSSHNLPR
jgi:hypothetical protein